MKPSARKLAAWYYQMAQFLDAGIPLPQAVEECPGVAPAGRAALVERLKAGDSLAQALGRSAQWMPEEDRVSLAFAASCGRLPDILRHLSSRRQLQADTARRMLTACIYPLLILHLAVIGGALPNMMSAESGLVWDDQVALVRIVLPLAVFWFVAGIFIFTVRRFARLAQILAAWLPGFRRYTRSQALADFCYNIGHLLAAGVTIGQSWLAAGEMTRRRDLRRAAARVCSVIDDGGSPAAQLAGHRCFPELFKSQYISGERSGQLDHSLLWLAGHYQEAANAGLRLATVLYPLLIFLLAALYVAHGVILNYRGYLDILSPHL